MENQPTPAPETGLTRVKNALLQYRYLLFVAVALAIGCWVFVVPIIGENKEKGDRIVMLGNKITELEHDNALMRDLLRPDCPGDSTGR